MAVAGRVLFQVILVVFFGPVEVLQGKEFDGKRLAEGGGAAVQRGGDPGNLVFCHEIDTGTVAGAFVLTLLVEAERVDGIQEEFRQAFFRNDFRILWQVTRFG